MDYPDKEEILHMAAAVIFLAFVFGGFEALQFSIPLSILVFLIHELAGHKIAARYFGAEAKFRVWIPALILGVITSFFGLLLAGPGGVQISKIENKKANLQKLSFKEYGIIALAGPLANMISGALFVGLSSFSPAIFLFLAKISFLFSTVNLLPIGPLDGIKIARWSWPAWFVLTTLSMLGYLLIR